MVRPDMSAMPIVHHSAPCASPRHPSPLQVDPFDAQEARPYKEDPSPSIPPLQVDPFDAQEARPYKQDPEIIAMTNLVDAYQSNNINEFEKVLRTNK